MQQRKDIVKLILFYILGENVVNWAAYVLWCKSMPGLWYTLMILAPILFGCLTIILSKRTLKLNIKDHILSGVGVGTVISFACIGVTVLIMKCFQPDFGEGKLTLQKFIELCCIWFFGGFCEEVGRRGVLFPLLRKGTNYGAACVITGIVWFVWHLPLVLAGTMLTEFTWVEGCSLFLVEVIALSFLMGAIYETKYGTLWTFVALHAWFNILLESVNVVLTNRQKRLFDNGYVLVFVVLLFAVIFNYVIKGRGRNNDRSITRG